MQTRQLGNADLDLSVVGLGTWAMGGAGWKFSWGEQSEKESIAVIRRALELGINWIDTAAVYGLGNAEVLLGKALKEHGTRPIIATKCGRTWQSDGTIVSKLTAESIRREVEDSLRRLQIDVIDLYQLHWPEPDEEIEEGWETAAKLVEEGKIRWAGVSNFSVSQLKRAQKIHPVTSLQPPYSMLNRQVESGLLDYCAAHNIGVIVYSPMQKGILTDKFTRDFVKGLPADDHRTVLDANFKEPKLSVNLELVDLLRGIAKKRDCTVAQLAIAWILRRPEVTAAIVGGRRPSQIEDTVKAPACHLTESDYSVIEMFLERKGAGVS